VEPKWIHPQPADTNSAKEKDDASSLIPPETGVSSEKNDSPDVGRLVELDESPDVATTEDEAPPEFITDPMQSSKQPVENESPELTADPTVQPSKQPVENELPEFTADPTVQPSEQPAGSEPQEVSPRIEAEEGPVITERKTEPTEVEITVPVVISRSQVRKTIPLKLRLDIRVIDD